MLCECRIEKVSFKAAGLVVDEERHEHRPANKIETLHTFLNSFYLELRTNFLERKTALFSHGSFVCE